jgi:hypothetical protein
VAGQVTHCDFWFPDVEVSVGFGQMRTGKQLPVLTMVCGHDVGTAWTYVTGIDLPAQCSTELQAVDWLGDTDGVTVGAVSVAAVAMMRSATGRPCARSSKSKTNAAGLWNVIGSSGVGATGFEVEPASDGVLIRQWGRMGPGLSGLTPAILAQPDKEARVIVRRLSEWQ